MRVDVVRRDDDPGAGLADQLGRGAVGRHDREDRPPDREVLEHLPGEHALATPVRVRDEQEQRLRVALEPQATRRAGRSRSAPADRRGRASPPTRGRSSGSRRRSGRRRRGPSRGTPGGTVVGRAGRRSSPVCVIRKRVPGCVLEPGEVVEVAAVRDRRTTPARLEPAHLLRDRLGHARDRVGARRRRAARPARAEPAALVSPSCRHGGAGARRAGRADRRPSARRSPSGRPRRRSGRTAAATS